jgi:3-hydroxyisobutyrate dehydrogenase
VKVGFIGLGQLGAPIARHIVDAGFATTLWARRPETLAPFDGLVVDMATSAAALAQACDVVGVCVVDDAGVSEVVEGAQGLLDGARPGCVIAVHSTVRPETCERLAEAAAERGVVLVDAPVSGGPQAALDGRLLAMVGGPADTVERCRPVFSAFADPVVHLGPIGAGERAKLVNNAVLGANIGVVLDALATADGLGVDADRLITVLQHGSGSSFAVGVVAAMRAAASTEPNAATWLLRKDVDLLRDTTRGAKVREGPLVTVADETLDALGYPPGSDRPSLTHTTGGDRHE